MVTEVVALTAGQPPEAGILYVTIYVPAVEEFKLIVPLLISIINPVVEEYVHPAVPTLVTLAVPVLLQ